MGNPSFSQRAKRFLLGAPRDLFDPKIFHKISLIAFFAWIGLGADGISSSCYGPEETYLALGGHGVGHPAAELPTVAPAVSTDLSGAVREMGWLGVGAILVRAYTMGAGTYTGIEAISNSMPTVREPRVQTGKKAMLYMAVSLSFIAGGIILGYVLNDVRPVEGKTLNAVLFGKLLVGLWGSGTGEVVVAFVLAAEAALLFVAAQTGVLGGPQVLSNMAIDSFMPHRFAHLSERLGAQDRHFFFGGGGVLMLYITGGGGE